MFVYRYSAKRWNDSLLLEGRLRLGTLHGYRDEENLPPPIGDSGEGTKVTHAFIDEFDSSKPGADIQLKAVEQVGGHHIAPGAKVFMSNVSLQRKYNHPDAYVYCISRIPSARLLRNMGAETCVEIELEPFYRTLCKHLSDEEGITQSAADWVQYGSRHELFGVDEPAHPAFIKPLSYSWQDEGRFIFRPVTYPVEPLQVWCPDLRKYCREVLSRASG